MAVIRVEGCGLSARDEHPDTYIGMGATAMRSVPAKTVPNQYCPNVYQELVDVSQAILLA